MTCAHCGALLQGDYRFCPDCGQDTGLESSQPQAPPAGPDREEMLRELRMLKELQRRALTRLERLESLLDSAKPVESQTSSHEQPDDFTFQNAADVPAQVAWQPPEPEPGESPEPAPEHSLDTDSGPRPFLYSPKDRPGTTPGAGAGVQKEAPSEPMRSPDIATARPPTGPPGQPQPRESLESALGRKWLLAVGIVVIVFGLGYFLKYSFSQGWIGPEGQLSLGYFLCALLLAGGEGARRRGYTLFGLWVLAGGMAGVYAVTFAGHRVLELLPQAPAFGIFAAATVATVALAVLHNAPGLAVLGLLGGYLTPFLLQDLDNMYFLLGFVTMLNGGVLAVSLLRRWNGLCWMGLVASYLVYAYWQLSDYLPRAIWGGTGDAFWVSLVFVNLTFVGYVTVPLLGGLLPLWKPQKRPGLTASAWLGAVAAYVAAVFTFFSVGDRYGEHWTALAAIIYALVFAALSWLAQAARSHQDDSDKKSAEPGHLTVLRTHSALFFLFATPLALDGYWITAVWALQAALLVFLGLQLQGRCLSFLGQLAALLSLLRLLTVDLQDSFGLLTHSGLENLQGALYTYYGGFGSMLAARWTTEALVLGALGCCAWLVSRQRLEKAGTSGAGLLRLVFGVGLLTVLSVECAAWFGETAPAARAASVSVLWAIYATGLIYHGFRRNSRGARIAALLLYGLTLLKVVLVDMEDFSAPYRIVSFLVLGALLVGGSFMYHRQQKQ